MTTTKPLMIGRHYVPAHEAHHLAGTHIMAYDPSAPMESYVKGLFGQIGIGRGTADERESRINAVLFAHAAMMREQLRAVLISVRADDFDHPDGPFLGTTSLAAIEMAENTLETIDKLIGE